MEDNPSRVNELGLSWAQYLSSSENRYGVTRFPGGASTVSFTHGLNSSGPVGVNTYSKYSQQGRRNLPAGMVTESMFLEIVIILLCLFTILIQVTQIAPLSIL